jgi:hypothetical protein
VRLDWKLLWLAWIPAVTILCSGCAGIAATGAISPLLFLLPKADPPPFQPDKTLPATGQDVELAQA